VGDIGDEVVLQPRQRHLASDEVEHDGGEDAHGDHREETGPEVGRNARWLSHQVATGFHECWQD
jgi:hypothetical protein